MTQTLASSRSVLDGIIPFAVYQPIVNLMSGEVVAYEALARGPAGTALSSPMALFEAARASGQLAALDWACRAAAVEGALAGGLASPLRLFVNAEPEAMAVSCPIDLESTMQQGQARLRPVMEVTERELTRDPASLLAAVAAARRAGWGIALDDVGADPASLALMPFLAPDVIKLDLRLIQRHTGAEIAEIVNAVISHSERTGATILAEGIETEEHRRRAISMGATLGQGWLLGRPGPLSSPTSPLFNPMAEPTPAEPETGTPFSLVEGRTSLRIGTKDLLLPMSHHLERQALRASEPPVLLAAFEHVDHFTEGTRRRFAALARNCAFVGALGLGMPVSPAPGVRGAQLSHDDPLRGEWVVTCVGPHFAGALISRDLGDSGPDRDRRFLFTVTYERPTVVRAARTLLAKIVAEV